MILLTFPSSSPLIFTMPFTWLSGGNGLIPWRDSSLPLSFRKSFPSLQTLCSFFSLASAGNYGTSAASPRDFCGFSKVPDAPLFSRFRTSFDPYIEQMFHKLVDLTEPICHLIDSSLANVLTFDTSGIELYVTENNPKTLNSLIKRLKAYYRDNPDVDPYRMAYALMPSRAASCPDAKQQYINGHFCYADKFAVLTNGLGIIPVRLLFPSSPVFAGYLPRGFCF